MFDFIKKVISKLNKLDSYVNKYKDNAGEVSMPSFAYMNYGIKLLEDGDTKTALELLKISANMPYTNSETYVNLGIAFAQEENFEKALEYFKKAIKIDRENYKAYMMMGSCFCELGENEKATKAFAVSLKINPRNAQIYINRGIFNAKLGKIEEASKDFQTACALNPSNANAWFLWGVLCSQAGHLLPAKDKLKKAIALNPYQADAFYHLANIALIQKDYKNSIKLAKKSIAIESDKIEPYITLAECYQKTGQEKECIDTYKNIDSKCQKRAKFYYSYALSLQNFKRWEEAKEPFLEALKLEEESTVATFGLAISHLKLNEDEEAIKYLEKTISIDPSHTTAFYTLGQFYADKNDYKKAIEYFKKAISTNVNQGYIYHKTAFCYEMTGDIENAIEYFKKAIEYGDKKAIEPKLGLIGAYTKAGDNQSALRLMRTIYKENKEDEKILLMYGVLLVENESYYDAIEKFDKILELNKELKAPLYAKIECLMKIGKYDLANNLLLELEKEENIEADVYYLRLIYDRNMIENENKKELISPAIDICDKIISLGDDVPFEQSAILGIKEELIKIREN